MEITQQSIMGIAKNICRERRVKVPAASKNGCTRIIINNLFFLMLLLLT
jgi:hypothetical protein